MKKLLFVMAIVVMFVACKSGSETTTTTDSTKVDSTLTFKVDSAKVDTTKKVVK